MKIAVFSLLAFLITFPATVFARVTPNDIYQQRRVEFEEQLNKISDLEKREKIKQADEMIYQINQKVSIRFEEDVLKLAAIMEEVKRRKGITETRVAFGGSDTPIEQADYWVNFAAEAVAYQKIQDYTPNISGSNFVASITSSMNRLKGALEILKGKISKAKSEAKKALKDEN